MPTLEDLQKEIDDILKDVTLDSARVKQSILNILDLFNLSPDKISIARMELDPGVIYVSATEECNVQKAKELSKTKYKNQLPAPITIIEHRNKRVIFIGSNRSIVFTLKGKNPDSIIVKLPNTIERPKMITEANHTLQDMINSQQ